MKPIEVWAGQATSWTRATLLWLDRWRSPGDLRIGALAGGTLRRGLAAAVSAAAAVGVAAGLLHLLVQVALRSDTGLQWLAVGVVAAIAAVLLAIVGRSTVICLAVPQPLRAHLIALLLSVAALLAAVQACAAATVVLAERTVSLWHAEQLYAWHLLDAVPLLSIPRRLDWAPPAGVAGDGQRAVLVLFTIALIVPLVRTAVAIYQLSGGDPARQPSTIDQVDKLWRPAISLSGIRMPWSGISVPLVVAGGFFWGGLGPGTAAGERIAAGSGYAAVAVVVATLGVLLLAALLWIAAAVARAVWEPISGGPWTQLVLATGLVWVDNPVRQLLLPSIAEVGAAWKLVVTLGLWAVLTVLLLPVWIDPYLPEAVLALALLLMFASAGAPGTGSAGGQILAGIGWAPGGFAVGPAAATAGVCLTGAYLVRLVVLAPRRAANAGRLAAAGAVDLRRELGGYAYIGMHIGIAAAGAMLLVSGLSPQMPMVDAPRSLLSVVWHVVDSLPGPDVPALAGWRPPTELGGPWVGAVLVVTVMMLLVCVAFPMSRATLRWARVAAGTSSAPERPLAEIPASSLADLEFVRSFLVESAQPETQRTIEEIDTTRELSDEQGAFLATMHEVEERLTAVERDRAKLRDLLGDESPVYWAAEQAVSEAADAYRTLIEVQVGAHSRRWSPWPAREAGVEDAITAIDVYAAAVERWQMGADVVTELESRLHDLDVREQGIHVREREAEVREHSVQTRERGVDARERMLELREGAAQAREQSVEAREQDTELRESGVAVREHEIEQRESAVQRREDGTQQRERDADARQRSVETREQALAEREAAAATREQDVIAHEHRTAVRVQEIDAREKWVEAREQNADVREQSVVARERNAADRERAVEAREQGSG